MIEKREWRGQNKDHCTLQKGMEKENWKYGLKNAENPAHNGHSVGSLMWIKLSNNLKNKTMLPYKCSYLTE